MTYIVLGASAAGVNAVRELRRLAPSDRIILVSEDREIYSRCILHHYLGGLRTREEINFAETDFEKRYGVEWKKGCSCTGVDAAQKQITLSDGSVENYDKLLVATGAHPAIPSIEGLKGAGNVYGFRNISDIEAIRKAAAESAAPVILGGGLVGIDASTGLLELGRKPVLVEMENRILCKQLDGRSAAVYQNALERAGEKFYLGRSVKRVIQDEAGKVRELEFTDGEKIPCDLLILTAGIKPNTDFLSGTGVTLLKGGLVVDEKGRTNAPDIYGAGDVTGKSPIWPAAVKEGLIAAANMTGPDRTMTDFFTSKSTMNFMGIAAMSLGVCEKPDDSYEEILEETDERYRKVIHKNGKIYGAILLGDLSYGGILTQLISRKIDVSKVKKPLFKIDYSDFFHIDDNFEFYYE